MAKTPKGIFGDKLDFIDNSIDALRDSYSSSEQWLLNRIIRDVLPELDVVDGVIQNTNTNITILTSRLNAVIGKLKTGKNKKTVEGVLKNMNGVTRFNNRYFKLTGDLVGEQFDKAKGGVETIMQKSLGFNPDGTLKPNSFVDSISKAAQS